MPRIQHWDDDVEYNRPERNPRKMKIRGPDERKRNKPRRGRKSDKGYWNLED